MRTITDTTFAFLKFQYERWVQEFLDDPDGMCMPALAKPGQPGYEQAVAQQITGHYRELKVIGPDCDTTFWAVALQQGTSHEIANLIQYLRLGGVNNDDDIPWEALYAGEVRLEKATQG